MSNRRDTVYAESINSLLSESTHLVIKLELVARVTANGKEEHYTREYTCVDVSIESAISNAYKYSLRQHELRHIGNSEHKAKVTRVEVLHELPRQTNFALPEPLRSY